MTIPRPQADECNAYFGGYVARVVEDDVIGLLEQQMAERRALLGGLDDGRALHRYAPGKWSLKEVLGHLLDCERVFAYRALSAARGDPAPLPGFEQDDWITTAHFDALPLGSLLDDLDDTRRATLALYRGFDEAALARRAMANGTPVTPRALVWILAGHERHHMDVIRQRYL